MAQALPSHPDVRLGQSLRLRSRGWVAVGLERVLHAALTIKQVSPGIQKEKK
jgi:hypothetical protein